MLTNTVATQVDEKKPYMVTTAKTKSSIRNIPIPKVLMEDMKVLYEVSKRHYGFNDDWYLFGDTDPITNGKLRHIKNKDCKLAEVKHIIIHDFRHSCASLLINSGATINVVAKYLGHTKIDETLNTYSHMYQNRLDSIVNIIELQNSRLNNNIIETKPTILLEHKYILPDPEEESYDYKEYEIVKTKNKDDLVL